MNEFIVIGKTVKPQGIKGQIKVMPITDNPERFLRIKSVYLSDGKIPYGVASCEVRDGFAYMSFDGVNTRDSAEALRGQYISILREDASVLPEGRYFIADMVGCDIRDEKDAKLGVLKEILQYGAADVYVVGGERGFSFPAVRQVVREVDVDKRVITVDASELEKVVLYED